MIRAANEFYFYCKQRISLSESHPTVINEFMALSLFYRCRCPRYISIDVIVTFQLSALFPKTLRKNEEKCPLAITIGPLEK